jgi:hypothetical protein
VLCGSERFRDVFSGAMGLRIILTRLPIVGKFDFEIPAELHKVVKGTDI